MVKDGGDNHGLQITNLKNAGYALQVPQVVHLTFYQRSKVLYTVVDFVLVSI